MIHNHVVKKFLIVILFLFTILNSFVIANEKDFSKNNLAAALLLKKPIGNEIWKIGATERIEWTSSSIAKITIYYSNNGGLTWQVIQNNVNASLGYYDWNITTSISPSVEAKIRILDSNNPTLIDDSNNFTITRLDLITPTGSNKLQIGNAFNIRWIASSDIQNVYLEYTLDNGINWNPIDPNIINAGKGSYSWIPINIPPSSTVQIRIKDATLPSIKYDISDIFSLASLVLIKPQGAENWFSGTNQTLEWSSQNISFIKIEYSTDNGQSWITSDNFISASPNNYSWKVPYSPTDQALIRISDANYSNVSAQMSNTFTISSIHVLSPNGKEGWTIGSEQTIKWESNIVTNVKLELSTNGGTSWSDIVQGINSLAGVYKYPVQNTPTGNALIRISDVNNSNHFDVSDNIFTIGSINIISPAGGEIWQAGKNYNITWTSTTGINVVKIEYSTDGTTWQPIIGNTNAATGSYAWSIPSNLSATSVQIRVSDPQTGSTINAISKPISISNLVILFPNGGENWESGTNHKIQWSANSAITNLTIQYSTDNGVNWTNIAKTVNASDGNYLWSIPSDLSSSTMKIKLIAENNPSFTALSNSTFKIGDISIVSPNGGEKIFGTGTYLIKWSATNSINSVRIEYSLDGGNSFINIISQYPAIKGTYPWKVPNVYSNKARIRVSDSFGSSIDDSSKSNFTIAQLQLVSPDGGEGFVLNEKTKIKWISNAITNIKIEYSPNNGNSWTPVASIVQASLGSYDWNVPSSFTSEGLIKITSLEDTAFYDVSNSTFKISGISVLTPNGNENYQTGSPHQIEWTASPNIQNVKIQLSTDNGTNWIDLISSYDATKNFSWIVTNSPTDKAIIKVSDYNNSNIYDISDNSFTIERLKLNYPNGGEFFLVDSIVNVNWASSYVQNIKLEYSTDSGKLWNLVNNSIPASPNSYQWKIPNTTSRKVLFRISDADNVAANISDVSDAAFEINKLYLINPNGGESYVVNSTQSINWIAHNTISNVKLEYSINNAQSWNVIVNSFSASAGNYQWKVPNVVTNVAKIRITDIDNTSIYDESNGLFSIGSMNLTSPNGGEKWQVGTTHKIKWNNISSIDKIKLEYSIDNGVNWKSIASSVNGNDQSYNWLIPNDVTSFARVKLTDVNDSKVYDISDNVFSIANLILNAPNGNEKLQVGQLFQISWNAYNVSRVDIDYSSDNGTTWIRIATGWDAGFSTYSWTVNNLPSSSALIRIKDSQYNDIYDVSDKQFIVKELKILAPNGNEGWQIGNVDTIKWSSSGVNTVQLYYSTDNGTNWTMIQQNIPASDLIYPWTVPNIPGKQTKIKIVDQDINSIYDVSNLSFVIGKITVTSPSSIDNWKSGETHEIKWTPTDGLDFVNIDYSIDGGLNWINIRSSYGAKLGSYFWSIPGNVATSNAFIRVKHAQTNTQIEGISDKFNINSLKITFPNGGDFLNSGKIENIQWSSSAITNVIIDYSTDNGSTWKPIINSYPASSGSYKWTVPASLSTKTGLIRIADQDNSNVYDISDTNFKIGFVNIISPQADSIWQAGTYKKIKWNFSSSVDFIKLEYSVDGNIWININNKTAVKDSYYNWQISKDLSSNSVQVRISDWESNLKISNLSDNFKIMKLNLISPIGGENWQVGTYHTISWNTGGLINNINIYYSTNNGNSWSSIINNYDANKGNYKWLVPSNLISNNVIVKIEDSNNTFINNISNSAFTLNNLKIISPISNTEYQSGKKYTIQWDETYINNVRIDYSLDNGTTYNNVVTNFPASFKSYGWLLPSGISTNIAKIRIRAQSDLSIISESNSFKIKQLDLVTPNGGEILQNNKVKSIQWNSGFVDSIDIYYSINNGQSWNIIVSNLSASLGKYDWIVPNIQSVQSRIKIVDIKNDKISDSSKSVFTIGTIVLTKPIGGEILQAGRVVPIQWNSSGLDNVKLEYSLDNGNIWNTISSSIAASAGSYTWNIPGNIFSKQVLVRVSRVTDAKINSTSGILTIKLLELSSPIGGETLKSGNIKKITWNAGAIDSINISYTINNGQQWIKIANNYNAGLKTFNWTVPNLTTDQAKIKIVESNNKTISDSSSNSFSIGSLSITGLNLGDELQAGRVKIITWASTGISSVKLEFSDNNGLSWSPIADNIPGNASKYSWSVPTGIATTTGLVKISSSNDPSLFSTSNLFTIKVLDLSTPIGKENWLAGSSQNIKWNSGLVTNIGILLSKDGAVTWDTLRSSYSTISSSYSYTVPDTFSTDKAIVKIFDISNPNIKDSSRDYFKINSLLLTFPKGGEKLQEGRTYQINWKNTKDNPNIKIEYTTTGTLPWYTISDSYSSSNKNYAWTIPLDTVTDKAKIRISNYPNGDIVSQSTNFTIAKLRLLSPINLVYLQNRSKFNISWDSKYVGSVRIEYSVDNGVTWKLISISSPNDSLYQWTVPDNISSSLSQIKISDFNYNEVYSVSKTNFTIGDVQVNYPNNGELFSSGSTIQLKYSVSSNIKSVDIYYSTNNGKNWFSIISGTPATGKFDWSIPAGLISDSSLIRVASSGTNLAIQDISDNVFTISAIKLLQPDGGENLQANKEYLIKWKTVPSLSKVKIEYYIPESGWGLVGGNIDANVGEFKWQVPYIYSDSALIRISNGSNLNSFDESNAKFRIADVILESPKGTEKIQAGKTLDVKWKTTVNVDSINLYYSKIDGNWNFIQKISAKNQSSYTWTLPKDTSNNYNFKIDDAKSNGLILDSLKNHFIVSNISIIKPDSSENLLAGTSYKIKWENSSDISILFVEFSTDSGKSWNKIDSVSGNLKEVNWQIPANIIANQALIRVSDYYYPDIYSISKKFSIYSQNLSIITPNGGEYLTAGQSYTFNWTASNSIKTIKLELSIDDGKTWDYLIVDNVQASLGQISKILPQNVFSSKARIRISSKINPEIYDISDASFVIGSLNLVAPNGGEKLQAGKYYRIKWNAANTINNIKIEYSKNQNSWVTYESTYDASLGYYDWLVPNDYTENAKIKLTAVNSSESFFDESDKSFTISIINLKGPSGGISYQNSKPISISWISSQNINKINLEYKINNNNNWQSINLQPLDASKQKFSWLPTTNIESAKNVYLRIYDANYVKLADTLKTPFTISKLEITKPNSSSQIQVNTPFDINWVYGNIDSIIISYSSDGNNWTDIDTVPVSDKKYSWLMPNNVIDSNYIKLQDLSNPNINSISKPFVSFKPYLKVIFPNGNEYLQAGKQYSIKWSTKWVKNLKIELYNGKKWNVITPQYDAGRDSLVYVVPDDIETDKAKILITDLDHSGFVDSSDNTFNISRLKLKNPIGGEYFQANMSYPINWYSSSNLNKVRIKYSIDGVSFKDIPGANIISATDTIFSWNIEPNIFSKIAKIRIEKFDNPQVYDTTNTPFNIGWIKLSEPNSLKEIQSGKDLIIKYSSSPNIEKVKIDLFDYSSGEKSTIGIVDNKNGVYTWKIPIEFNTESASIIVSDMSSNYAISDTSKRFVIKKLNILSPKFNDILVAGDTTIIKWYASSSISRIGIQLSINKGLTWLPINKDSLSFNASKNQVSWIIPRNIYSSNSLIRIYDYNNNLIADTSRTFTIYVPDLRVLTPNGGEYFGTGSKMKITWSGLFITAVVLDYSLDYGKSWNAINNGGPIDASKGELIWEIPKNIYTDSAIVRIKDFSDLSVTDVSDLPFKIGYLNFNVPKLNEHFRAGLPVNLKVKVSPNINKVDFYYTDFSSKEKLLIPIASSTVIKDSAKAEWISPNNLSSDKVKIYAYDSESLLEISDSSSLFSVNVLNILKPNGGEFLSSNSVYDIKWNNSPQIKAVKLSIWDGKNVPQILSPSWDSQKPYNWNIPENFTSDSLFIIISDVLHPNVADTSNLSFKVGALRLLSFQNKEKVLEQTIYKLKWQVSPNIESVDIDYKLRSSNTWQSIARGIKSINNEGFYNWSIPPTPSDSSFVRIKDSKSSSVQVSNTIPFTIARFQIVAPNGGEYLRAGDTLYTIKIDKEYVDNFDVYYTNNYQKSQPIWSRVNLKYKEGNEYYFGNLKKYKLTDASNNYKIRIVDNDAVNIADTSEKPFTVSYIKLTDPNGGGGQQIGTSYDVKWVGSTTIDSVDIYVKTNNDVDYFEKINKTPLSVSSSPYIWNIEIAAHPQVKLKIVDAKHPEIFDESDNTFKVSQIELISPIGNERTQINRNTIIKWKSTFIDTVRLEYNITGNATDWRPIPGGENVYTSNSGNTYSWLLDQSYLNATKTARVRVSDFNYSRVKSESKNNFLITRLELTSPNKRIAWKTGVEQTITWEEELLDSIKILLYDGNKIRKIGIAPAVDGEFKYTPSSNILTNAARIIIQDLYEPNIADTSNIDFVIGLFPKVRKIDKYQRGTIIFNWDFESPGEKITVSDIKWKDIQIANFTSDKDNLSELGNTYSGPVINKELHWNSKIRDGYEGFVDFQFYFKSEFGVTYIVELDSVKIDNKAPSFDISTLKVEQNPFIEGWNKVKISWDPAVDSSNIIDYSIKSANNLFDSINTKNNYTVIPNLYTATDYSIYLNISDSLNNDTSYNYKFRTLNLADYDNSKKIDIVDVINFTKSWSGKDSLIADDFAPYNDTIPNIKVIGDQILDANDLIVFINMWQYSKQNKLNKKSQIQFDVVTSKELVFKKGQSNFDFPIDFIKYPDVKFVSTKIIYNDSFIIDSLTTSTDNVINNKLELSYNDSTNHLYYYDYANLSNQNSNSLTIKANIKTRYTRLQESDSLIIEVKGYDEIGNQKFSIQNIYSLKQLPKSFELSQNYPNPFNPTTTIEFQLPYNANVNLTLYNILGQRVAVLVDKFEKAGIYKYILNTQRINNGLASGVYFYRIVSGKFIKTKKLILLK